MSHSNVSIFIPHIGCPNMCSFCNQRIISGTQTAPTGEDVRQICSQAFNEIKDKKNAEIAFFGGSFTAIENDYMMLLLESVQEFLGEDGFGGIRISTRPDCIDDKILTLLKKYKVTSIELGAQSMQDDVLEANNRGHKSCDVVNASNLIRNYGFELGLQMMVGLYKSSLQDEYDTMRKIIRIHPDTVRIYPVVVLAGTELARLFECGEYVPEPFDTIVGICADMLSEFENNGISVIKCGLHASEGVEGDMVAGYYHPAFRELCESRIYRSLTEQLIIQHKGTDYVGKICFAVNPSCISKALGHKKSNYDYFKSHGIEIKVVADEKVPKYKCELRR